MCSLRTKSEMRRFFSQLCTILWVHLRFFHHFSSFFMATSRVDSSFCNTSNWIISSSHQQRICDPLKPLNPLVTIFLIRLQWPTRTGFAPQDLPMRQATWKHRSTQAPKHRTWTPSWKTNKTWWRSGSCGGPGMSFLGYCLEWPVASLYSGFCQAPKSLKSILEPILQILETILGICTVRVSVI